MPPFSVSFASARPYPDVGFRRPDLVLAFFGFLLDPAAAFPARFSLATGTVDFGWVFCGVLDGVGLAITKSPLSVSLGTLPDFSFCADRMLLLERAARWTLDEGVDGSLRTDTDFCLIILGSSGDKIRLFGVLFSLEDGSVNEAEAALPSYATELLEAAPNLGVFAIGATVAF